MNSKLLTIIGAVMLLSACSKESPVPTAAKDIPELERLTLQTQTSPQTVTYDGIIEAINQATVSAQTSGRIVEMPVDVGDFVAKGDLIIRFTDTEQKARAASAQAQFNEAQAQFTRMQEMLSKKLIAQADFDKSQAAFKAAEAALREAEQNLAYTSIYAPYSGIVVSRAVNVGETVAPGKPLMTGLSLEQLRAQVNIPQQHIGPVRKYKQAQIYLRSGEVLHSSELRIPPSADPQTHSFSVLVNLPEGNHDLFPGTFVKIAFVTGEHEQLLIPASSISQRGEVSGVYVIKDNALEFRQLNLGSLNSAKHYPVLAGLTAGETIALDPIVAANAYKKIHRGEQ